MIKTNPKLTEERLKHMRQYLENRKKEQMQFHKKNIDNEMLSGGFFKQVNK